MHWANFIISRTMTELSYKLNSPTAFQFVPSLTADALLAIARESYQQYVAAIGREPAPMVADYAHHIAHDTIITSYHDDVLVGFGVIIDKDDGLWLETIAVADGYRGQGIGTKLLAEIERYIAQRAHSYQLYTNEKMTQNMDWYLRLGFTITAVKEEEGFQRIYFKKELS